jgi:hypothetical protein
MKIKKIKEEELKQHELVIGRVGDGMRANPKKTKRLNKKLKEAFAIALCMAMMNITTLYAADQITSKIEKWTTWLSGTLGPAVLIIGVAIMGLSSIGKDDSRDMMSKGKNIAIAGICVTLAKSIIGFLF